MADPVIYRYLRDNKDRYDMDLLKQKLAEAGHIPADIEAAEHELLDDEPRPDPVPLFPHPVFNEIRKEAEEWNKEKVAKKEDSPHLNFHKSQRRHHVIDILLIIVALLGVAAFVYFLLR